MPVYNQQKYVATAIRAILQQTFSDFEFIIIDDGSTDDTLGVVKGFRDSRIRLIEAKHEGFLSALRKGVTSADGRWIARMDSDDLCHPQRLEKQLSFLQNHPGTLFVTSIYGIITPNDYFLAPLKTFGFEYLCSRDITLANYLFCDPATVFEREKALQADYDDDWENEKPLWYKLLKRGKGAVLGTPLYYVRWLVGSHSRSQAGQRSAANYSIRAKYDPGCKAVFSSQAVKSKEEKTSLERKSVNYYLAADDFAAARQIVSVLIKRKPFDFEAWKWTLRAYGRINFNVKENLKRSRFAFGKVETPW